MIENKRKNNNNFTKSPYKESSVLSTKKDNKIDDFNEEIVNLKENLVFADGIKESNYKIKNIELRLNNMNKQNESFKNKLNNIIEYVNENGNTHTDYHDNKLKQTPNKNKSYNSNGKPRHVKNKSMTETTNYINQEYLNQNNKNVDKASPEHHIDKNIKVDYICKPDTIKLNFNAKNDIHVSDVNTKEIPIELNFKGKLTPYIKDYLNY